MDSTAFAKEIRIMSLFTPDRVVDIVPIGHGHINTTCAVKLQKDDGTQYRLLLQKINDYVFPDVEGLMDNICRVTEYLKSHLNDGEDPLRSVMTVVPSIKGNSFEKVEDEYYRCYVMIENTASYQKIEKYEDFFNCGWAFGDFQRRLGDFPAETLCETIKNFHNTESRYADLVKSIGEDKAGRKAQVEKEIEFCLCRRHLASAIVSKLADGTIPLRVTHNDSKLNNMLFDADTDRPLCIVDLDTVMPGAACYDFGDAIRFGGTRTKEDETDLSKVSLDLELFRAYTAGYLKAAKEFLTPAEIDTLAVSALVITYENGMRFLKDYLDGDVYYGAKYPTQTLDRCRTHLKFVADMETKLDEMKKIVAEYAQ